MTSSNKRIAKNTAFLYFRMFLIMGVSLYTSRVVLKTLGVEDYGIYNVVAGIVTMFSFLNGSLGAATSRYITYELGRQDYVRLQKIFNVAFMVHVFMSIIIVILSETIGLWFFFEKMTIPEERMNAAFWVYQISILTAVFTITQVPYDADIIAHEDMKIYAYVGLGEVILKLSIVYFLVIAPFDRLIFYALLVFFVQITKIIYTRWYCLHNYSESHFVIYKDKQLYKEIFSYAGSDMIGSIAVMAQGQGLNLLLNAFFGPVVNAARAIAYQIQGAITQFSNNFFTAVKPQIIKLYAEGKVNQMMKLVEVSGCFSFYLLWIVSLPICLEADYILRLWLGEYPEHTRGFLVLIIILCLIQSLKTPRSSVYHALGKLKFVNIVVGGILCAAFPLAYLFLKLGGNPETVFWAANISVIISEIVSMFVLKRYINYSVINYMKNVHLRCALVSFLSILLPYFIFDRIMEPSFIRLICTGLVTSLSIVGVVWTIGINQEYRQKLICFVKYKIKK